MGSEHHTHSPSLVVMEVPSTTKAETLDWLLMKIQQPRREGGCELFAKAVPGADEKFTLVHVTAVCSRLLQIGESIQIKKEYHDGSQREVTFECLDRFKGVEDRDNFFTLSEKQRLVAHEMENMRALDEESCVPGTKVKLLPGESIVERCLHNGVITQVFPLHDKEHLKRLASDWYSWKAVRNAQPTELVRLYFGETLAFYFAFIGFYTLALLPPAGIGLTYWLTGWANPSRNIFFAVFNLLWGTILLEWWKRYSSELAYKWGCIDTRKYEQARPAFYGLERISRVTGKPERYYPKYKRMLKYYGVSVPVLLAFMGLAYWLLQFDLKYEVWVEQRYAANPHFGNRLLLYVPSTLYACVIAGLNAIYRRVAVLLTDWENHRLQSTHDNHLIFKLILFYSVNCFVSLFYIAFYMQDMKRLRQYLASLLIVSQILDQLIETIIPYFLIRFRSKEARKNFKEIRKQSNDEGEEKEDEWPAQYSVKQAEYERCMDQFEGTLDDFLEMYIQFGYVFLFSAVFPFAAVFALVNNITEIRFDAFKLCRNFQRPFSRPAENIGAWQTAFELLTALAVVTNCSLVALNPGIQAYFPDWSSAGYVLLFVGIEHLLLCVKLAVMYIVPDRAPWVQTELARVQYQAEQALKKQRLMRSP